MADDQETQSGNEAAIMILGKFVYRRSAKCDKT